MDNGASSYRRFLDGDEAAFDLIMQELFPPLVFFIDRYVQDHHAAEDLAMDVFADLIVHKRRYNFKVSLKTYLFMLGRSRALDYLRHKRVLTFVPLESAEHLSVSQSLEDALLADARKKAVHEALMKLPEEQRSVIHLVYYDGLSYEDAAKVLRKNRKQVDNLLYRAKKQLRIILGKDGELI